MRESFSLKLIHGPHISRLGIASLYIRVTINRTSKLLPLDLSWPVACINKETGELLKRSKQDPDLADYNMIITSQLSRCNEVFKVFRLMNRPLSMDIFLKELKVFDRRKDFIAFMEGEITDRKLRNEISPRTYKNHRSTLKRLKQFRKELFFYELDHRLIKKFVAFLKGKGNEDSTVWGRVKDIKTYLTIAKEDGIPINEDFHLYDNVEVRGRIIFLEDGELTRLMQLLDSDRFDLCQKQTLRAFLFSCFTSIRISDVMRADFSWITIHNELHFLPYKGRKANRWVTIPLLDIAQALIIRKSGRLFDLPTEQEMNRSLKDIAEIAGIHKHLTYHLSRHTFATQFIKKSGDVATLKEIMGHTKIEMSMRYVHITSEDKKRQMQKLNEAFPVKLRKVI